jgi:hypothetical protein
VKPNACCDTVMYIMSYGNTVGSLRQNLISSREGEIVFGTLLGDGYLQLMKNGKVRLEVAHSMAQEDLVRWKYEEMKRFAGANPHLSVYYDLRYKKEYSQLRFKTKSDFFFLPFHRFFYGNGMKNIPDDISSILKSPLSLAVWFMDDGGRRNDSCGLFLNTLSFSLSEQELLRECLRNNFSIESRIHFV